MKKDFYLSTVLKSAEDNDDGSITIEGYASTTAKDRTNDIILAEAWEKDNGLANFKLNPIILFNHNYNEPIGRAIEIRTDSKGLGIRATISKAASRVVDLIRDGVLSAFSVGFRVLDADYDQKSDIFVIKSAELFEISVVSVPANQEAVFSVAKSFDSSQELEQFKNQFTLSDDLTSQKAAEPSATREKFMDPKDLEELVAGLAERAAEKAAEKAAQKFAEAEAEKAAKAARDAEEEARRKQKEEDSAKAIITATMSGAEKLLSDLETRIVEKQEATDTVLAELKTELEEKRAEILKMRESKRSFAPGTGDWRKDFSRDMDEAYVLGAITNKGIDGTDFGKDLIQKVNAHSGVGVSSADFEQEVSSNIERDIQLQLVLAPLFREIQMRAATMILPVLPDAGYAEFTANQAASGSSPHGNLAQTGDAYGSAYGGIDLTEKSITTKKLISQTYLGNETEEDAIIPILPLIRESMIRSHARAVENMILVGNHADGVFGTGGAAPNGLVQIADADGSQSNDGASGYAATDKILATDLLTIRRNMGKWAINPNDVIFVVSQDVYYDLLEDTEWQDVNLVGSDASKLVGVVGSVWGSKVIVSPEFAAKAAAKFCAVCVNPRNYIVPRLRGFRVESDNEVANQRRVLVMSQRIGFEDIINSATSVWGYQYKLT